MKKSFKNILTNIKNKKANILTTSEILEKIKSNESFCIKDIDVVTTGTRGLMSGTYAILSISLKSLPLFKKAKKIYMNGIECNIGPCPNENLNIVDLIIFGTSISCIDNKYGAGHLFRDLVSKKEIDLIIQTNENKIFESLITIDNIYFSKLVTTRSSLKNYKAFVNKSDVDVNTIFHPSYFSSFKSTFKEATVSGCGSLNPLQNDPYLKTIGIGTKILVNGAEGYIIGLGTRSSTEEPNLMIISNMKNMNPEYMGGFNTSMGPECIVSLAIPLININNSISIDILNMNKDIPLSIVSVDDRSYISNTSYKDVWDETDNIISINKNKCLNCTKCLPSLLCPCNAISKTFNQILFFENLCFNCGYCTTICGGGVFMANLGNLKFKYNNINYCVPIVCRQSDIYRAKKIELELKDKIIEEEFKLSLYSEYLL